MHYVNFNPVGGNTLMTLHYPKLPEFWYKTVVISRKMRIKQWIPLNL